MMALILIGCCIVGSFFFSGAETAIVSASRIKIRHLAGLGNRNAMELERILEKPDRVLSAVLVGNNFANVLGSILAATFVISLLGERENIGIAIATLVMTPLLLIFGEAVPKSFFYHHADRIVLSAVPLLKFFLVAFYPLIQICSLPARLILLFSRPDGPKRNPFVTREELKLLVMEGPSDVTIDEQKMIRHLFRFGETVARSVMVPLGRLVATDVRGTVADAMERVRESGHSRVLLYDGRIGRIIGHVAVQDILGLTPNVPLSKVKRPVIFVPENKKISDLLLHLSQLGHHMAVVVNRYRKVSGLVTLEDIIEEIVGEIEDEYDGASSKRPRAG